MKKRYLLILPILIFSLFGCVNSLDDNDDNSYSSSGFVTASGTLCVPNDVVVSTGSTTIIASSTTANSVLTTASRQAFPTAASGTLYYTLTCKGGSVTTTGTVDSSALTFTINVPVGSSTITAKAFVDSAKSQQVYEGTLSLTDVTTSTDLSSQTITLNDLQSGTDATATVSLPILINSDVTISSISAVVSTGSTTTGTSSTTTSTTLELSSPISGTTYYFAPTSSSDTAFSTTAASSANTVPGNYDVTFSFYATDSSSGTYLAYQTTQKITASNYLTTSTWTGIGSEPCINSSGVLEITKSLCTSFLLTTFYVDQTNGSDISVTGSFSSPFKSIQQAVQVVEALETTSIGKTYTIYLKGDITATSADDDFTNGSLVEIADSANVSLVIKSYPTSSTFTIDATSLGRIFYIGSGNTVTIKNVTLKNGKVTDSSVTGGANGGAIFASGTFTFSGNTVVTESSDNNDVYLDNSSSSTPFITLADDFTGTSGTTSARITLASYTEDYVVLSGTNVATQYEYFKVTDEGYQIGSDGKLDVKETIYTSWEKLSTAISSAASSSGFNFSCKIGNISDFNNSRIYLSGYSSSDTINILPSQNASITIDGSSVTEINEPYFQVSDSITATVGSKDYQITIGDSSYASSTYFVYGVSGGISSFINCKFQNASTYAIDTNGTLTLQDCAFEKIQSSYGAVYVDSGTTTLDSCTFTDCTDYDVYLKTSSSKLVLQGTLNTTSIYVESCAESLITLDTSLALADGAKPTVKLYSYTSGTALFASSDSGTISEKIRNYFTVTDDSGTSYSINADGTLSAITSMPTDVSSYSSSNYLASGTYTISSADDLVNLSTVVSNGGLSESNTYEFDQTADIDMSGTSFTTMGTFNLSTSSRIPFRGTFDGKNFTIKNLSVSSSEDGKGGLFAAASKATIKNINLENVSATVGTYSGAICGYADVNTVVSNCNIKSGTVVGSSSSNNYIGGIIGYNAGVIANCTNAASVSCTGNYCGGIVGTNLSYSFVINCSNTGTVSGPCYVGGISGNNKGLITNSVNSGSLSLSTSSTTNDNAGGISGINSGYIANCVSVGTISPNSTQSGGIGAICYQPTSTSSAVYNSYGLGFTNVTNIAESGTYSSNSQGTSYGSQILDSSTGWSSNASIDLYTMTVKRSSSSLSVSGTVDTTNGNNNVSFTSVVEALNYFIEFGENKSFSDGTNTWTLEKWSLSSENIPTLGADSGSGGGSSGGSGSSNSLTALYDSSSAPTSGTEYSISSENELYYLSQLVNTNGYTFEGCTVKLSSDVALSTYANWTPIGYYSDTTTNVPFSGTFDGNNFKITGLAISSATSTRQGIFGYTKDANLKNINVSGSIESSSTIQYVGGVVGEFVQSSESGTATIENCISSVTINMTSSSASEIGGIAGIIETNKNTTNVINCVFNGTISASGLSKVGGISGEATYSTTFYNCENSGNITASSLAGGIFGYGVGDTSSYPIIKNCVGNVALSSIAVKTSGGLIGNYNITTITGTYADYCYYVKGSLSNYASIGTTTYSDEDTVFDFTTDGSAGTLNGGTQDVGSSSFSDVVESLNAWITESSLGNDSSYSTYKKWSYNSSGLPTILTE